MDGTAGTKARKITQRRGIRWLIASAVLVGLCLGLGSFEVSSDPLFRVFVNPWAGFALLCALWFGWWGIGGAAIAYFLRFVWLGLFSSAVQPAFLFNGIIDVAFLLAGAAVFFWLLGWWRLDPAAGRQAPRLFVAGLIADIIRLVLPGVLLGGLAAPGWIIVFLLVDCAVLTALGYVVTPYLRREKMIPEKMAAWLPGRSVAWPLGQVRILPS